MLRIFLLAGVGVVEIVALAGCTTDSSVPTTPTFSAARYVPAPGGVLAGPAPEPRTVAPATVDPSLTGSSAIAAANRESTVEPDAPSLHGATWYIEDAHPDLIYMVCTQPQHVSTILLPPGERFNGAVGGNVDAFLINVSYAGPRPAVSILPRMAGARGNLQLVTTAGFYSFRLASCREALNLADVSRRNEPAAAASALPQPEGDFTRLTFVREDGPLPAWAPAEAWADSRKMTLRFNDPLPVLPTLFAGRQGEQIVNYRTVRGQGSTFLVTDRRVTEAELRLGSEKVRITVDPDAVKAGTAADPAQGGDAWKPTAGTVEAPPPVLPSPLPPAPIAAPAGRQPMAANPVLGVPSVRPAVRL